MARKSLQDLTGIANTIARSGAHPKKSTSTSNAPALGALQGSLSAIREIDPSLIDDWGPLDRLDAFTAVNTEDDSDGFDALMTSIKEDGQQVPILVRRAGSEGRFEAIFGRRRLKACRELGIKVKANVQEIDDATALLAKGLENAARRNLSFYEKARFAVAIQAAGHDMATVRKVLNLSPSGLSHLTKVTDNVPSQIGDLIGAAPKSGRPKWTSLAETFESGKLAAAAGIAFLSKLDPDIPSDERLDLFLKDIVRRGARHDDVKEVTPIEGVSIKSGRGSIAVTIKRAGENAAFAEWLDSRIEGIIKESYHEFTAVNSKDDTRG